MFVRKQACLLARRDQVCSKVADELRVLLCWIHPALSSHSSTVELCMFPGGWVTECLVTASCSAQSTESMKIPRMPQLLTSDWCIQSMPDSYQLSLPHCGTGSDKPGPGTSQQLLDAVTISFKHPECERWHMYLQLSISTAPTHWTGKGCGLAVSTHSSQLPPQQQHRTSSTSIQ
jgi:hypothetical protein